MIPEENTLAEIVRKFPAASAVFEKYDLDYCCGGKKTLRAACTDEVTLQKIEHALHRIIENDSTASELIEHIVNKHHAFVKSATPVMQAHLEKALARHGAGHPELQKIFDLFM